MIFMLINYNKCSKLKTELFDILGDKQHRINIRLDTVG